MTTINVTSNMDAVLRTVDRLGLNVRLATQQAMNKTATTVMSRAVKNIAKDTGIKQKTVRDAIRLHKASKIEARAIIEAKGKAPNLINFGARKVKAGVSANAWGKRKIYPRVFIGNKGRTVFKRLGKARLPIRPVWGPSIPKTFLREHINRAMVETTRERFPVEFQRAVAIQLRQMGFKA